MKTLADQIEVQKWAADLNPVMWTCIEDLPETATWSGSRKGETGIGVEAFSWGFFDYDRLPQKPTQEQLDADGVEMVGECRPPRNGEQHYIRNGYGDSRCRVRAESDYTLNAQFEFSNREWIVRDKPQENPPKFDAPKGHRHTDVCRVPVGDEAWALAGNGALRPTNYKPLTHICGGRRWILSEIAATVKKTDMVSFNAAVKRFQEAVWSHRLKPVPGAKVCVDGEEFSTTQCEACEIAKRLRKG